MKRLFFKKNLTLKSFLSLFFLFFLLFSANFFYNQSKAILAAEEKEEEIDYEKLKCGREIPVGEAMEKTGELLEEIIRELERIEANSYYLIETQKEMEELANKCSLENCIPKCKILTIKDTAVGCISNKCQGDPCDKEKITELFDNITDFNEEIQAAKDKIYKLIYESVEPLCIEENEDIRTDLEKARCIANPVCRGKALEIQEWIESRLPEPLQNFADWLKARGLAPCPLIKPREAIRKKLNLSRGEFDKCYLSPEDIEKVILGEETGKYLFNCPFVLKEDYPRYTKTEIEVDGKKISDCTSPYNWFCCTDTP